MVTQSRTRRLGYTLLAAGALAAALLALGRDRAAAQGTLRWASDDRGSAKPIALNADEITTWKDQGRRLLLLKGTVWIEQGEIQTRAERAVVRVEEAGQTTSGLYRLDVYAEGNVTLADGVRPISGETSVPKALIRLNTRGQINVKTYSKKVTQEALPRDRLYLTALAELTAPSASAAPAKQAAPAPAPPPVVAPPTWEPPAPAPAPAAQPAVPLPAAPAPPSFIQRVSAQEEAPAPAPLRAQPVQGVPPGGNPLPLPPVPPAPPGLGPPPGPAPAPAPAQGPDGLIELPAPRLLGPEVEAPDPTLRQVIIRPRSSEPIKACNYALANGETAVVVSNGVIVTILDPENKGVIDIEADRLVTWTRGNFQQIFKEAPAPEATAGKRPLEFFLSGHVEIREQSGPDSRLLRADEVYYDVNRGVAIATDADLEVKQPALPDPLHLQTPRLLQLNPKLFQLGKTSVNASKLPYDPQLKLTLSKASLEEIDVPKRGLFGLGPQRIDPKTGQPISEKQKLFRGSNVLIWLGPVPVFYLPYVQGDPHDPLGPVQSIAFNYSRPFGVASYLTLDAFNLFGITPVPGERWRFNVDYLSARGPALGTDYLFAGKDLFGVPNRYNGDINAYGMYDRKADLLGGDRGNANLVGPPYRTIPVTHPPYRGRFTTDLNVQELPAGFTFQGRLHAISDRNFLEQYFNAEWNNDLNQETIAYLKQQNANWAWTLFGQAHLRNWITETEWMPKVDGYLIGQKFFDLFTYNGRAEAGYAHLMPAHQPPPPISITDQNVATARLDWGNEVSLPFTLGPVRIVPYVTGDLTYYSEDLNRKSRGRAYGGLGMRSSLPLSRLFPDVESEFFNVNGIYHKIVFSSNYYNAHSDTRYTRLPQLDRLNDDTTDQALRDFRPYSPIFLPGNGVFLNTSGIFQPQAFAIRNLVDNRIDTIDTIEVLQGDVRQRWQTKRGYPGAQHIVDWMTLDLNGSYFPSRARDNFGEDFGLLKYDWVWHVGDRFSLLSDGWYEPLDHGPRTFTFAGQIARPDNALLLLGYTHLDPLRTRQVTAALVFPFSSKYSMMATSGYDFGNNIQINSFVLTRVGTDVQVSIGINYNSILSNFGFTFEIFPNLLPAAKRVPGSAGGAMQSFQGR